MKIAKTSVRKLFPKASLSRLFQSPFDDTGQSRDAVHSINYAAHETLEKVIFSVHENHVETQAVTGSK